MRAGVDRRTGKLLTGWDHCAQSIAVILTTRIGMRVMRRAFGNEALELQDANGTRATVMRIYAGIAAALKRWEPGFRLVSIVPTRVGPDGVFGFQLTGRFFPRGHLGDYSISEDRSTVLAANDNGFVAVAA